MWRIVNTKEEWRQRWRRKWRNGSKKTLWWKTGKASNVLELGAGPGHNHIPPTISPLLLSPPIHSYFSTLSCQSLAATDPDFWAWWGQLGRPGEAWIFFNVFPLNIELFRVFDINVASNTKRIISLHNSEGLEFTFKFQETQLSGRFSPPGGACAPPGLPVDPSLDPTSPFQLHQQEGYS